MNNLKHGDLVTFEFNGVEQDGLYSTSDYGIYIATNNPKMNGSSFGRVPKYEYSWKINSNISQLRKKGTKYERKVVPIVRTHLGCDPEFFFMEKGKVLSSEKVLPEVPSKEEAGMVTIDGVQAEINPTADTCRESHSYYIARCIKKAHSYLKEGQTISFDPIVPIDLKVLAKLSDKAKFFGCTPSFNVYDSDNKMSIDDSSKYPFRPAGGHIHLGHSENESVKKIINNINLLVPMLDIIVGNTCVLIDRHDGNRERRRCYGRAGEFRTPKHGLEYRTLSNFWLNSYQLMSFVFGLARMAMSIVNSSTEKDNIAKEIMDAVNQDDIRRAINDNDFELALKNFSKIKPILNRVMPIGSTLCSENMIQFLYFVGKVQKEGLKYWFKQNPVDYWVNYGNSIGGRGKGWERFLSEDVREDMSKATQLLKKIRATIKR